MNERKTEGEGEEEGEKGDGERDGGERDRKDNKLQIPLSVEDDRSKWVEEHR